MTKKRIFLWVGIVGLIPIVSALLLIGLFVGMDALTGGRKEFVAKKADHIAKLHALVEKGAKADEVSELVGGQRTLSKSEAQKINFGWNDITHPLIQRWPSVSFATDGDFAYLVFYDADGKFVDFAIASQ